MKEESEVEKKEILEPEALLNILEDLEEEKKKLVESEKKRNIWINNSPACTKIVDLDLNLQYMSHAGVAGLGVKDVRELYGKPYPLSFYPESFKKEMTANLKKAIRTGKIIVQEAPVVDTNGKEVWFHSTIVPVKDDKGKLDYLLVVSMDTTKRKVAERALRELNENLESTVKQRTGDLKKANVELRGVDLLKDKFLTITSHELKTPLTPAKIQVQMLLAGDLGELNEKQKKSFDIILRNINRLDRLIGDILEISRLQEGGFKLKPTNIQLRDSIMGVLNNLVPVAKKKGIALSYTGGKLPLIAVDKDRIEEVLHNLVDNAIKFTEVGTIKVVAKVDGANILVNVVDTGVGISKENMAKMFKPFFQVEPMYTRKHGGTGLGLSIVKAIIERHGGKLGVKSIVGKGSAFWFTLPITVSKKKKVVKREVVKSG